MPQGARSRTAHGLTAAAAEGRFALQVCADCGVTSYPPRDACPRCLSARVPFQDVPPGGVVLAETTVRTSTDVYFRERTPWRIGTVLLDCGPSFVAHLHGDVAEGDRVRMALRLDKSGNAVAIAMPAAATAHQADDAQLRELTCDPKFRRVLVTDGRNATGQAMARAMAAAGASIVFVGIADAWKPYPERGRPARHPQRRDRPPGHHRQPIGRRRGGGNRPPRRHPGQHRRTHAPWRHHAAPRPDGRPRGDGHALLRPAPPGAAFRPDNARPRRRRRQRRRRFRQPAVGPRADELAGIRRFLRRRGGVPVGRARRCARNCAAAA